MHRARSNPVTGLIVLICLAPGLELSAQTSETAGQAEVAFQSYYLGGSGQPLIGTAGMAVNSSEFIPGVGLLTGTAEGYGSNGFRSGNLVLGLQDASLLGWHWDFVGGDFHFSSNLVDSPFLNIYTPEIAGRGFRVAAKRDNQTYQFFVGEETLLAGPRIPFRVTLPQQVLGASMTQKLGKRWQVGVRYLNFQTDPGTLTRNPELFLGSQQFRNWNSLTFQSSYTVSRHLTFYSEASYAAASSFARGVGSQRPFSLLVGPSWESNKFSLRANYVQQSMSYLPLLGYFVGDRKGPYVEGHYRPAKRVDFYGSATTYSNNLEDDPVLPTFHSHGYTAGTSLILPWKFDASASLSTLSYNERDPSQPERITSDNRELNFNLSRPIGRHRPRLSVIDMKLNTNSLPQTQRFTEAEDTFTWKRLVLGGAIREQNLQTIETRNTLFFRGSLQTSFKRLSAYAYMEKGNDLVNRSVFSTTALSSTVAGLSAPLFQGWTLQFEAFRNKLNTDLNPENIFLFGNSGLGLGSQLAAFNQWSVFCRVSKQFHWGKELPKGSSLEEYTTQHTSLVGSVQGLVMEQSLAGLRPAANVAVSLDHSRGAVTDASGRYQFVDVPEGAHEVGLDLGQLPTEYAPSRAGNTPVSVRPRAIARADFGVVRLTSLTGRVVAPPGAPIDSLIIRLAGTDCYTTPDAEGDFGFYNLREGEYQVAVEQQTVPPGYLLASTASVRVLVSSAGPSAPIGIELSRRPSEQKPVREVLQGHIRIGSAAAKTTDAAGRKGTGEQKK